HRGRAGAAARAWYTDGDRALRARVQLRRRRPLAGVPRHVHPPEGEDRRRRLAHVPAVLRPRDRGRNRSVRQRPRHDDPYANEPEAGAGRDPLQARRLGGGRGYPLLVTVDRDAVLRALERVIDPELRKPVTELNMVRDVSIEAGDVAVTIALTVAGCPLRSSFQDQVAEHVGGLPNVERVELRFDVMSPDEKAALTTKL